MNTTVVAVIGDVDDPRFQASSNVDVVRTDAEIPVLDRAVAAWARVRRSTTPYALVDVDPLEPVVRAWAERFDGTGVVGDLEVARAEILARWRASSLDLPDFYLLVDPDALSVTERHWYLGVLGATAPQRVVAADRATALADQVSRTGYGRWWPELDQLLVGIEHVVPDQVIPMADQEGGAQLVEPSRLLGPDD